MGIVETISALLNISNMDSKKRGNTIMDSIEPTGGKWLLSLTLLPSPLLSRFTSCFAFFFMYSNQHLMRHKCLQVRAAPFFFLGTKTELNSARSRGIYSHVARVQITLWHGMVDCASTADILYEATDQMIHREECGWWLAGSVWCTWQERPVRNETWRHVSNVTEAIQCYDL